MSKIVNQFPRENYSVFLYKRSEDNKSAEKTNLLLYFPIFRSPLCSIVPINHFVSLLAALCAFFNSNFYNWFFIWNIFRGINCCNKSVNW